MCRLKDLGASKAYLEQCMWSPQDALKLQSANGEFPPCFRQAPSPQAQCHRESLMSDKARSRQAGPQQCRA